MISTPALSADVVEGERFFPLWVRGGKGTFLLGLPDPWPAGFFVLFLLLSRRPIS